MLNRQRMTGFTLVELMIVVVIVGILMAVAYPAYQNSTQKGRRTDGIAKLNEVMQAQERWFVQNQTYVTDLTNLGYPNAASVTSEEGFYVISAAGCGTGITECVILTGTAQGGQAADGNLTLNSRGARTRGGNTGW